MSGFTFLPLSEPYFVLVFESRRNIHYVSTALTILQTKFGDFTCLEDGKEDGIYVYVCMYIRVCIFL